MGFSIFFKELAGLMDFYTIFTLSWSTMLGIIFGALPGLTGVMAISLLVGMTYEMSTQMAMVVLLGVYVGAIYGASKSAILIGIPGTSAGAATVLDGFKLAKKGEAGPAIGLATISSTIGTVFGMIFMVALTPALANLALEFQTWEYFLLGVLGVVICGNLSAQGEPIKGWISGFLGLLIALVGLESMYAYPRFAYGNVQLMGGISFVPAMIGLFGMTEVIDTMRTLDKKAVLAKVKGIFPHWKDVYSNLRLTLQSGLVGVFIGIVPGAGEDIAAWVSYDVGRRTSKQPEKYGTGIPEGIVAAETANNACIGGALIPALSLGIPGSGPAAVLLSAIWLHGIRPGPLLMVESPNFIYMMSAILLVASFMMCALGLFVTAPMNKILKVPKEILMPVVMVLAVIGSYAINLKMFDVVTMFAFGVLGYILRKVDVPAAPMVLGLILGKMVDENIRRALVVSKGTLNTLFERPIALILFLLIIFMLVTQSARVQKELGKLVFWKKKVKTA